MTGLALMLTVLPLGAGEDVETETRRMIVVVGAAGTDEYGKAFEAWSAKWRDAATRGGFEVVPVGNDDDAETTDARRLRQAVVESAEDDETWLVFLGHGTFDGRTAKLNLRGPDVSEDQLAAWLAPLEQRVVVIHCGSASGSFATTLRGPNRVVVTATKSGQERFFARFGGFLADAIATTEADLDKDGQTSLFEAWLRAARLVDEFYREAGRLPTEHGLLEDDGDGRGSRAEAFAGLRPLDASRTTDGLAAHQLHVVRSADERLLGAESRDRRDALEQRLARLRANRSSLTEAEYLRELEAVLVPLAEVYESADRSRDVVVPANGDVRRGR